jgi:peroxidase
MWQGCDGSLLLNSTPGMMSEKFSLANNNSARGFEVIDTIKAALEAACPQTVSCADILAIASRDSAVEAGLCPGYPVYFGRRDSLTANISAADAFLPAPFFVYTELNQSFHNVGLDEVDLVALSGAHTIGRASCKTVQQFLNDTDTNALFRERNAKICPPTVDNLKVVVDLDLTTPNTFDSAYYRNLLVGEGLLRSDQVLWSTPGTISRPLVGEYAGDQSAFFTQFALSTIKMGNIKPLTGHEGEIRLNCAVVNDPTLPAIALVTSQ